MSSYRYTPRRSIANDESIRCHECGAWPGQDRQSLIYNRLGDNYPCPTCGGHGWVATAPAPSHFEPLQASGVPCPDCQPPITTHRELTKAERLAIEIFLREVPE